MLIPENEISIQFSRSGGKGGQNVNKVETRVQASFCVRTASFLSGDDKAYLLQKLASRLDSEGTITVAADDGRSQAQNRERAIERLNAIIEQALVRPKKRVPTKPTRAAKFNRRQSKQKHSEKKESRKKETTYIF